MECVGGGNIPRSYPRDIVAVVGSLRRIQQLRSVAVEPNTWGLPRCWAVYAITQCSGKMTRRTTNICSTGATPNIHRYTRMPGCLYKTGFLRDVPVTLVDATAQSLNTTNAYDTVLIVNVIEHVMDAFDFVTACYRSLRPGGLLIFAEQYFEDPDEASTQVLGSGMLHPIRLKRQFVEKFLAHFDKVYQAPFEETKRAEERGLGEVGFFFIGRKR